MGLWIKTTAKPYRNHEIGTLYNSFFTKGGKGEGETEGGGDGEDREGKEQEDEYFKFVSLLEGRPGQFVVFVDYYGVDESSNIYITKIYSTANDFSYKLDGDSKIEKF